MLTGQRAMSEGGPEAMADPFRNGEMFDNRFKNDAEVRTAKGEDSPYGSGDGDGDGDGNGGGTQEKTKPQKWGAERVDSGARSVTPTRYNKCSSSKLQSQLWLCLPWLMLRLHQKKLNSLQTEPYPVGWVDTPVCLEGSLF